MRYTRAKAGLLLLLMLLLLLLLLVRIQGRLVAPYGGKTTNE